MGGVSASQAVVRTCYVALLLAVLLVTPIGGCSEQTGPTDTASNDADVAVTSQALSAPPEPSGCTSAVSSGRQYWFCTANKSWSDARAKCQGALLDLAVIDNATENAFVMQRLVADAWIGGTDSSVEGVWRWAATGTQFWQGTYTGSAIGGAYTNWASLQPNSSLQDCAEVHKTGGQWSDETCSDLVDYVCEGPADLCPSDPNKDAPGQCGCGTPDTDADADGVAACHDACDNDPAKTAAGQCGCGNLDTDTDGDGSSDCVDACDEDSARTVGPCSPDTNCTHYTFGQSEYFFCSRSVSYSNAEAKCEDVGLKLARIDSSSENTFIRQHILTDRWIGGTDTTQEGVWRWQIGGQQFWQGAFNGSAVGGAYTNWNFGEPNDLAGQDCLQIDSTGKWNDDNCAETEQFICEGADQCLDDANKFQPGQCGCGVPDTDNDNDGVANCLDLCPNDARRVTPGDCGCADASKPSGTTCDDGLCGASTSCDGHGMCGTSSACGVPDSSCTLVMRADTPYWFCTNHRQFSDARQRCQSVGMEIAAVQSVDEDLFLRTHIAEHTFLGGSDQTVEGTWRWLANGSAFWSGNQNGGNVAGAYTNWESGQPSNLLSTSDCMVKDPPSGGGFWETSLCTDAHAYVCEGVPSPGTDPDACVEKVKPRDDLTGAARERAYQADLLRQCIAVGDPACLQDLRAQVNVDYFASAGALVSQQKTPAQYLAVVKDRERKARAFEHDPNLAAALCAGDADGDFVPNATDACPNTPPLTPTDSVGCTDNTLPPAPSAADVATVFANSGFAFNSKCHDVAVLPKSTMGGFYWGSDLARGVYVFATRVTNQPSDCPVWYLFDVEEIVGASNPAGYQVTERYMVAFKDSEEVAALMGEPVPVPPNAIQFHSIVTDPGTRGLLAGTAAKAAFNGIDGVRFRLNVMNGAGMRSGWSEWRITSPDDCKRLGIDCQ